MTPTKTMLLITCIFAINLPVDGRFPIMNHKNKRAKRNCILYNEPSKEICDKKYPNRLSAEEYAQFHQDLGLCWMIMMVGMLIISAMLTNMI